MDTASGHGAPVFPGEESRAAEPYGCGHINETYLVTDEGERRWILQKINARVFPDIPALMENISRVTAYLREQVTAEGAIRSGNACA